MNEEVEDEREKCRECNGRGWNVGECHPREECGICEGAGYIVPRRCTGTIGCPNTVPDGQEFCSACQRFGEQMGEAAERILEALGEET
jgi:hypothetical protein